MHPSQQEVPLSTSELLSESVNDYVGSWRFVRHQTLVIAAWLLLNMLPGVPHWDPYPNIFLTLLLGVAAAYTAPLILMSQNRQVAKDRTTLNRGCDLAEATNTRMEHLLLHMTRMSEQIEEIHQHLLAQLHDVTELDTLVQHQHQQYTHTNEEEEEETA